MAAVTIADAWQHRVLLAVDQSQTNTSSSNITAQLVQLVPVSLVRNGVTYIILYSMFATLLFVLLCAVLFKNGLSPQKRRLPVVWVLGLAMLGGLLGSTLNTVFWAYQLFGNAGDGTMFRLWMSSTAMLYVVPLVTHIAIQLRLMSFYPSTLASRRKRIIISILPTLMKIGRLITISITLHQSAVVYGREGFGVTVSRATDDTSNLFTLIFQLVDTLYASILLLWRYWHLGRRDNDLMSKKSHPVLRWTKQIMFAIAFGYVLPTIYAFALLLCRALSLNPVDMGFMLVANIYVQAFGAVLATLSSSYRWREDRFTDSLEPDNAVRPGMREIGQAGCNADAPANVAQHHRSDTATADRDPSALESTISEMPPNLSGPRFLSPPFSSLDSRRRGTSATAAAPMSLSCTPSTQQYAQPARPDISPMTEDGGDISPRTPNALIQLPVAGAIEPQPRQETRTSRCAADKVSLVEMLTSEPSSQYTLERYETRRSSDATLFPSAGTGSGQKEAGSSLSRKLSTSTSATSLSNGPGSGSGYESGSRPGSSGTGKSVRRFRSNPSVNRIDRRVAEDEQEEDLGHVGSTLSPDTTAAQTLRMGENRSSGYQQSPSSPALAPTDSKPANPP